MVMDHIPLSFGLKILNIQWDRQNTDTGIIYTMPEKQIFIFWLLFKTIEINTISTDQKAMLRICNIFLDHLLKILFKSSIFNFSNQIRNVLRSCQIIDFECSQGILETEIPGSWHLTYR